MFYIFKWDQDRSMHVTSIHFTESGFRLDLGSELCKWTEAKEVVYQVTHPAMQTPSNGAQLIGTPRVYIHPVLWFSEESQKKWTCMPALFR